MNLLNHSEIQQAVVKLREKFNECNGKFSVVVDQSKQEVNQQWLIETLVSFHVQIQELSFSLMVMQALAQPTLTIDLADEEDESVKRLVDTIVKELYKTEKSLKKPKKSNIVIPR